MKINNSNSLIVGQQYKITEPCYDDYEEGLTPEADIIEVIKKTKHHYIFKNVEHGFTYERTYQHLLTCKIETYGN